VSAEALGDGLIEALHRLQQRQGWLSPAQLVQLSHDLSVPASRVQGVATF
jgi:NADH:ubiquinone oxidoreductase subunit E